MENKPKGLPGTLTQPDARICGDGWKFSLHLTLCCSFLLYIITNVLVMMLLKQKSYLNTSGNKFLFLYQMLHKTVFYVSDKHLVL